MKKFNKILTKYIQIGNNNILNFQANQNQKNLTGNKFLNRTMKKFYNTIQIQIALIKWA